MQEVDFIPEAGIKDKLFDVVEGFNFAIPDKQTKP